MKSNRGKMMVLLLGACAVLVPAREVPAARESGQSFSRACEADEAWAGFPPVARDLQRVADAFFRRERPAASLLSEGLVLRRMSTEPATLSLAEYAIARALLAQGQVHAAFPLFEAILLERASTPAAEASVACLNRLLRNHPALTLTRPEAAGLRALEAGARQSETDEFLFRSGLQATEAFSRRWLDGGADSDWKRLARAMRSVRDRPDAAVEQLAPILTKASKDAVGLSLLEAPFRAFAPRARLLLTRALYELGRHSEAARVLKDLPRHSNEFVSGLQELAWAQLMAGVPAEAVGTALGFQAGGLARVFAPESWMVMGMAFMELCRYPEARRAIDRLRETYGASAEWLAANAGGESNFYLMAVEALGRSAGGRRGTVPAPVSSEWIRSPVFQEMQREWNLGREEARGEGSMAEGAVTELRRLGARIAEVSAAVLRERTDRDRRRPELAGEPLRSQSVQELRELVRDYRVLRSAGAVAGAILKRQSTIRAAREPALVAAIERDLRGRTLRMRAVLEDVAANARLIEVELLQGASRELVLTHARGETGGAPGAAVVPARGVATEGWNWGRRKAFTGAAEDREEVWEDEIGAFRAEVADRCR